VPYDVNVPLCVPIEPPSPRPDAIRVLTTALHFHDREKEKEAAKAKRYDGNGVEANPVDIEDVSRSGIRTIAGQRFNVRTHRRAPADPRARPTRTLILDSGANVSGTPLEDPLTDPRTVVGAKRSLFTATGERVTAPAKGTINEVFDNVYHTPGLEETLIATKAVQDDSGKVVVLILLMKQAR
jgi:hypothetical protein